MKHRENFIKKYKVDPIELVEKANLEYFGLAKTIGLENVIKEYIEKHNLNIEINDDFLEKLVESFAEAGEKFPENQKITLGGVFELDPTPVNPSIPKSKGTLEDFKDIVGYDDLRPSFQGVYVSKGFLYGIDGHKLIKYKTNDYSQYEGKLINIPIFISSKGKKIDFIDHIPPQYEQIIPISGQSTINNLPTYNFYNLAKSVIALKKLQTDSVFNINFDIYGELFCFNPILISDVLHFALCKGFDTFNLEYSTPTRSITFDFKNKSLALVMPIRMMENKGTRKITIDEVVSDYGHSKGTPKTKSVKTKQKTEKVETEEEVPYKKFQGNISDTSYIPRRDISYIVLKNGEKLSNSDIIDGFYRVKKHEHGGYMAKGGGVGRKTFAQKVKAVEKTLVNKKVKPKYKRKYGKTYDKSEAHEAATNIIGKQKAKYDATH